ncbi:protein kinase [Antrihabitans cavernicola]|uniref:non-specific serine/threonine protein kinase n=1 Tax=Antrihabitans cavernicola TaxID=2495913 RepID=A0A5A7S996_9NOCA|nr:serine/threonine-protein kinase [Spelaeibacter cavernicola]KAA0022054.1 protein kinase [Spelaeibacter cavernicola]
MNVHNSDRPVGPSLVSDLAAAGFDGATEVGRGGFGVVYKCLQRSLGRTVAIKLLSSDLDAENRERFLREGYAMGRLSGHPHIVNILQVGVTSTGRPYIVMPYHPKNSLATRIRRDGNLEWTEAIRIGIKLAGALQSAHNVGTLHRDVKPANVLLSDYGEPQLTDFGIARIAGGFETATGAFTGSLAYTAPEVLQGQPPTASADVYGLGATIYSLIAGHAAYDRRTGEELVAQFLRISSQPVPDLRPTGVPDDVCAAIERAMAAEPEHRQGSVEELGDELREAERRHGLRVDAMVIPPPADPEEDEPTLAYHQIPTSRPEPHSVPQPNSPARYPSPQPQPQPLLAAPTPHPLPPAHPDPAPARRKRGPLVAGAVLATGLLVAAIIGGFMLTRGSDSPSVPVAASEPAHAHTAPGPAEPDYTEPAAPSPAAAPVNSASTWRTLPDAKLARQQSATTVANGTIWVLGGLDNSGSTNKVQGYDPAIATWKSGPDLPAALNHPTAADYNNELVVIGGWEPDGPNLTAKTSARVLALRNGAWVDLPPLHQPRAAGAAAVVDNKLIVTGGQGPDKQLATTTEVYDGAGWTVTAGPPTPREHLAATTDGTYLYAVGGRNLSSDKNTAALERYDPVANTWASLPAMPTPRGGLGATYLDGRIIAVGGEEPIDVLGTAEAYDVAAQVWTELPSLATPRHGLAVAAVGNTVYAINGAMHPTHAESTATTEALDFE